MTRTHIISGWLLAAAALAVLTPRMQAATEPQRIEVTAKKFSFDPSEITVKKGVPVDLVVHSIDVAHGLRIRELHVDLKVAKGGTAEVQFTPAKTGTFVGHCSVFCGAGHASMMLKMHVVD